MSSSGERAKTLIGHDHIIFFEVWIDANEDLAEVAAELAHLQCSVAKDHSRGVVRAFSPGKKPSGFLLD